MRFVHRAGRGTRARRALRESLRRARLRPANAGERTEPDVARSRTSRRSRHAERRHASTIRCGEASTVSTSASTSGRSSPRCDEPCSRKRERPLGTLDFGAERVDARTICRGPGPGKRRSSRCSVAAAQRDLERDELAPRCQHGRRRAEVQIVERVACFGHPAKQEQPADLQERGVKSVVVIAQGPERAAGFVERVRRPLQIARRERHLGFGRDASCALNALSRAERARRTPQQHPGLRKLTELSHGDPAQSERGRVVSKRDPLERTQGVAGLECPRCRRDQRIHAGSYAAIGRRQNPSQLLLTVRRRRS